MQSFFEDMDAEDVDVVGDPPVNESHAYHYWYAPENSMGIKEMKTVNWSYFKQLFLAHTDWMLEYKRYSYSSWNDGSDYLTIERTWNDSGFWKFNLILDVPVHVYSARFTFGIDLPCLQYVERSGYEVWINYTANATETYSVMFNWSDIASIPGLVITKGRTDNMFWFRFRRDGIPSGHYEFDPTFGNNDAAGETAVNSWIRGCFAMSVNGDGVTDNITVKINIYNQPNRVKCALYTYIDYSSSYVGTLIAESEIRSFTTTPDGWQVFDITANVVNGTNYYILVTAENATVSIYKDDVAGKDIYKGSGIDFNTAWENPLTGETVSGNEHAIYCSYTVSGGDAESWQQNFTGFWTGGNASTWTQNFSGWWSGGNDTVTWKNNFSGWWSGGNDTVVWQQNFMGYWTGGNAMVTWKQNFMGYWTGGNIPSYQSNFSGYFTGGNNSETWQSNFSGYWTGGNISVTFEIVNEYPENLSNIYTTQPTLYFTLTHPSSNVMNYTIYTGNSSVNCTSLLTSAANVSKGTHHYVNYYNMTEYYTNYFYSVHANDGSSWVNETYNFQAILQEDAIITTPGFEIFTLLGAVVASMLLLKRRKK